MRITNWGAGLRVNACQYLRATRHRPLYAGEKGEHCICSFALAGTGPVACLPYAAPAFRLGLFSVEFGTPSRMTKTGALSWLRRSEGGGASRGGGCILRSRYLFTVTDKADGGQETVAT